MEIGLFIGYMVLGIIVGGYKWVVIIFRMLQYYFQFFFVDWVEVNVEVELLIQVMIFVFKYNMVVMVIICRLQSCFVFINFFRRLKKENNRFRLRNCYLGYI